MKLRILGSGTIAGGTGRHCAGFLIDDTILADCGPGIWSALYRSEQPERRIDHIVLSHFHVDHFADLIPFLWRRWVLETERGALLSLYGPAGLESWFGALTAPHADWIAELEIRLVELSLAGVEIASAGPAGRHVLSALPTGHSEHSICLKVSDAEGKSLFYSGDSGPDDNLAALAAACDLAIMDCALPTGDPAQYHLTPETAAAIAAGAGVKRLVLTHLYPEVLGSDPVARAARRFPGEVLMAADGMVVLL